MAKNKARRLRKELARLRAEFEGLPRHGGFNTYAESEILEVKVQMDDKMVMRSKKECDKCSICGDWKPDSYGYCEPCYNKKREEV